MVHYGHGRSFHGFANNPQKKFLRISRIRARATNVRKYLYAHSLLLGFKKFDIDQMDTIPSPSVI